jgi:iron complex outermembrane receptor protein
MNMIYFFLLLLLLINFQFIFAQEKDSVQIYRLGEITVKSGIVLEPKSVFQLNYKNIEEADANNLFELTKYIPSVKPQTNSRGESLIYLRGSGERQISLFFDGVPLNIPWDNRIDLSLIPTDAVGGLSITKGIPSVIYGANTLAGVVNVSTKEFSGNLERNNIVI